MQQKPTAAWSLDQRMTQSILNALLHPAAAIRERNPLAHNRGLRVTKPMRIRLRPALLCLLLCPLAAVAANAPAPLEIEVDGADSELANQLRLQSGLADLGCDAPRWRVQRLFKASPDRLLSVLRVFGYYRPQIDKRLSFDAQCWHARFNIQRGEPVRITQLELAVTGEGEKDPAFAQLLALLPLHQDDILRQTEYESAKQRLTSLAAERGYLEARLLRHEIRVDPERRQATVALLLDTGPRYRLGTVTLPEIPLSADMIERYTNLTSGKPYSSIALTEAFTNLRDSGYFSQVDLSPKLTPNADHLVDVTADLKLEKRHVWRAGVGFETDTGPRLNLGYQNRYLNSHGHQLNTDVRYSPVLSSLETNYQIPGADPLRQRLTLRGGVQYEDTGTSRSTVYGLSYLRTRKRRAATTSWSLDLNKEDSQVGVTKQNSLLLLPGASWDWQRVEQGERPRSGERLLVSLRATHTVLLSDTSFARLYSNAKAMRPLGPGRIVARSELGATLAGSINDLPASQRFFAGGDNSVRGYEYETLGPLDTDGQPTGGRFLFTGSLEYQLPVRDNWSMALFADAGNAFEERFGTLKSSVGVGAIWHSPFAPIRLYLAFPQDTSRGDYRIHFSMGPEI